MVQIFEDYMIPHEVEDIKDSSSVVSIYKLTDKKSGAVYIERFDSNINTYSVYKFDKFNVPNKWQVEEGSDVMVTI